MIKQFVKQILRYRPLTETAPIRVVLDQAREPDLPYCPNWEGDLIWSLISTQGYRRCLETGFGTGSTALYMLHAVGKFGRVVSVDMSAANFNDIGKATLRRACFEAQHSLVEEQSERVLPQLFLEGQTFDFIFIDGWKTFDHLIVEIYMANRLLTDGGTIMFDDARMASVHKAIDLLKSHYGYREVNYVTHHQNWRLRLFHILTTRSLRRPYRAFVKVTPIHQQPAFLDYRFFSNF